MLSNEDLRGFVRENLSFLNFKEGPLNFARRASIAECGTNEIYVYQIPIYFNPFNGLLGWGSIENDDSNRMKFIWNENGTLEGITLSDSPMYTPSPNGVLVLSHSLRSGEFHITDFKFLKDKYLERFYTQLAQEVISETIVRYNDLVWENSQFLE